MVSLVVLPAIDFDSILISLHTSVAMLRVLFLQQVCAVKKTLHRSLANLIGGLTLYMYYSQAGAQVQTFEKYDIVPSN